MIENTTTITDARLLRQISSMYEAVISIKIDIVKELKNGPVESEELHSSLAYAYAI